MIKENLNNTLENTESSSTISNKLKAFKKVVLSSLFLVLPIDVAIAQNNTSIENTKAKTEIVTNEILSPEEILAKHKITDIATATVEQLQIAFNEITELLKSKTLKEEKEMPYITLRGKIRNQITVTKAKNETEKERQKTALAKQMVEDLTGKKRE